MNLVPDDPVRVLRVFRAVIGGATVLMLATSWPLWMADGEIPRVPFVAGLPIPGVGVTTLLYAVLVTSIALSALGGLFDRIGPQWVRILEGAAIVSGIVLVSGDQHRFQPWFYQFLLAVLLMATGSAGQAVRWNRAFVVGIYLYSGLSKLDYSFTHELGPIFLQTLCRPLGMNPADWPVSERSAAILAMPIGEIVVGVGLAIRKTRRVALAGAILLHLSLLGILGPWGLNQSINVLIWNAALIAEVVVLFGGRPTGVVERSDSGPLAWVGWAAILVALVMPLTERAGYWDAWPSFALYSSSVERVDIYIHEDALREMTATLRGHVSTGGAWRRLDLTSWSRALRRTPVNPQARACLGIAEGLAFWDHRPRLVLAVWKGRADRWTGRRETVEALGVPSIRRLGDRYRLNAHPAPRPGIGDATRH